MSNLTREQALQSIASKLELSGQELFSLLSKFDRLDAYELSIMLDNLLSRQQQKLEHHAKLVATVSEEDTELSELDAACEAACKAADQANAEFEETAKRARELSKKITVKKSQPKSVSQPKVTVKTMGDSRFVGTTLEGQSFREAQAHVKATINQLNIKGVKASIKRMGYRATTPSGLVSIVNHIETILGYMTEADATAKTAIAKAEGLSEMRDAK